MRRLLWKWVLRPVLIIALGAAGLSAIERNRFWGAVFSLISLVIFLFALADLLAKLGIDLTWLSSIWKGLRV